MLDLKKEWNVLSIIGMKLLLQQELYEPEWSHISMEDISKSQDQFKIDWQQFNENNKNNIEEPIEELKMLSESMHSLKWRRKRQRLTFHEKLLIYIKLTRDEIELRRLCTEFHISRATVLKISQEFKKE